MRDINIPRPEIFNTIYLSFLNTNVNSKNFIQKFAKQRTKKLKQKKINGKKKKKINLFN